MQHILLTGATGFLGSHLLEALLTQGYKVTILKRSTSDTWRINHVLGRVNVFDIDKVSIDSVFVNNSVDVVIHLATFYRKNDASTDVEDMIKSNVTFPSVLLEAGIRSGLKGFINTGTFFEYDCSCLPVNESNDLKPFNFYAKTKLAFDVLLNSYRDDLNVITLRLFSPYGPKDNDKVIPHIIKKALIGAEINLSEGLQKLDFTYCEDVVGAYLKAVALINNGKNVSETFNIGTGRPHSIREIVSILEEEMDTRLNVKWAPPFRNDFDIVYSDVKKTSTVLGWHPRSSIRAGLISTLKYYEGLSEN